jgi:molybdopterin-guanine dinucleotide biosynthesis protein
MNKFKMSTHDTCPICAFSRPIKCWVTCSKCAFYCCRSCTKKYLLEQPTMEPKCMSCKSQWDLEFIAENTDDGFHNKEYREHRAKIMMSTERSLLPSTQPYVVIEMEKRAREKELKDIIEKLKKCRDFSFISGIKMAKYRKMLAKRRANPKSAENELMIAKIKRRMDRIRKQREECYEIESSLYTDKIVVQNKMNGNDEVKEEKKASIKFIGHCPQDECKGYLDSKYVCGLCGEKACRSCRQPTHKGEECDKNIVETIKLLASDTKGCPNCGIPIYKISGCFAEDTDILMWNCSTKKSQDIVVGDELIGDDGTKRTVLSLCQGEDQLYEIVQNKAESYVVNSQHKLSLKVVGQSISMLKGGFFVFKWFDTKECRFRTKKFNCLYEAELFAESIPSGTVDITVRDYLKLPPSQLANLVGYRSNGFDGETKSVLIDPYLLGTWLGDGLSSQADITGQDMEIIQYWMDWAERNDSELVHTKAYHFKTRRFGKSFGRKAIGQESVCKGCEKISCSLCQIRLPNAKRVPSGKTSNPLKDLLMKYDLINNKHIPNDYMTNDRKTRLELLAGLIDTDGSVQNGKRINITQVNPVLSEQIIMLSRSLGFVTNFQIIEKKGVKFPGMSPHDCSDQYRINISGAISVIPTRVARKKCVDSECQNDLLRTRIFVTPTKRGKYYGWEVDGSQRFVLPDFTVVHNCDQMYCTSCHTAFDWVTGNIVHGRIHNPHFYEWQREHGGAPREAGDVRCGGPVDQHTLIKKIRKCCFEKHVEKMITNAHMLSGHIRDVVLPAYVVAENINANRDLRVRYLIGDYTEKRWVSEIKRREKKREKTQAIHMILTMFADTIDDLLGNIMTCPNNQVELFIVQLGELRRYTSANLAKIEKRFQNKVPTLDENWNFKEVGIKKGRSFTAMW